MCVKLLGINHEDQEKMRDGIQQSNPIMCQVGGEKKCQKDMREKEKKKEKAIKRKKEYQNKRGSGKKNLNKTKEYGK